MEDVEGMETDLLMSIAVKKLVYQQVSFNTNRKRQKLSKRKVLWF